MRKYIATVCILFFLYLSSYSQTDDIVYRKVDSLKKVLKTAKGNAKIDCLNVLAADYLWLDDGPDKLFDTGYVFANQAYNVAKTSNYKRGLGYAYLNMGWTYGQRVDDDKTNNNTETNYLQAIKYANQAIEIGEDVNDYNMVGDVYNFLKWMERWKGDRDKCKNDLQKAIYYYEKPKKLQKDIYNELNFASCSECIGNEKRLADDYNVLGIIYSVDRNSAAAEEQIKKAIHYTEMTGGKQELGNLYFSLSQANFRAYDYKSSKTNAIKSISYYKDANDVENEIMAMTETCKVYEVLGDFEDGLEYGKESIKLVEELNRKKTSANFNRFYSGMAFFWMCRLYAIGGDYQTAIDIIRQGRNHYHDPIDSFFNAIWRAEIGDVHRLMKNYDSAQHYLKPFATTEPNPNNFGKISLGYLYIDLKEYDKALELAIPFILYLKKKINGITVPLANCLFIAASASLGKKNYLDALQYAREGLDDLKFMDGRVLMINNYKLLSEIFQNLGRNDSAYYYLKQYTGLKDSLLDRQFYFRLNNYKKEAEEERKTSQINLLNKDNQLKEQKLKQQAIVRNSLLFGIVLFFLLGVFVFRNLLLKRKNEKLQLKNELDRQQLENEKKHAELKQQALELEMQALRAQMNPHFIFNCLSSINRFIFKNETKAASDYLTRFSRLIRMVLMHSQRKLIPLEDELEMLRLYLDMERLRFKDAFDYTISTTNAVESTSIFIPPLLLQPFCENAIWHGLMHKKGEGRLHILISEQNQTLHCIITDNGIGREKAAALKSKSVEKEKSLGLQITTKRLALLNGENSSETFYEIEDIINENGEVAGTKVSLKILYKESIEEMV